MFFLLYSAYNREDSCIDQNGYKLTDINPLAY